MKKIFEILIVSLLFTFSCKPIPDNEFLYECKVKAGTYLVLSPKKNTYPFFYSQPYSVGYNEPYQNIDSVFVQKADSILFTKDTVLLFEKYLLSNKEEYLYVKKNEGFSWLRHKIPLAHDEIIFLKTFLSVENQSSAYPDIAWVVHIEPFYKPDKLFIETVSQRIFIANKKTKTFIDFGSGRLEGCHLTKNKRKVECGIDLMWGTAVIDEDGNKIEW